MEYLLLIYSDEQAMAALSKEQLEEQFAAYRVYTQSLIDAGVMRGGNALDPVGTARSVRVRNGKTIATDGPFAETKEQLGGYYLIECADMAAAEHWAATLPAAVHGTIEVRAIMDY
jgi:hypothetical protein